MVMSVAKLVDWWIVHKSLIPHDEHADARQFTLLWLFRCTLEFDPHRGVRWSTYAALCIRSALRAYRLQRRMYGSRSQHKAAMPRVPDVPLHVADAELPSADDVLEALEHEAALARLREAIERLPELDREVILRHERGETLTDIGKRRGSTRQNIGQIETRIRIALRKQLRRGRSGANERTSIA